LIVYNKVLIFLIGKDIRKESLSDVDYQTSTTTLQAYWTIPSVYDAYILDSFVKIEERLTGGKYAV
jgi:hypothetical protein